MERRVETKWTGNLSFRSQIEGRKITIDAHPEFGGENRGPSPEELVLASLSSCTGMDVASLLQKMRVKVDTIKITSIGELTCTHPKHFSTIHLIYEFAGTHLRREKINEAVELSQEKYCGLSHMLGKVARLTYDIVYLEKAVPVLHAQ